MAAIFDEWKAADEVAALAEPVVMLRPPHDHQALLAELPPDQRQKWADRLVEVSQIDISSSELRENLRAGRVDQQVRQALPLGVLAYIHEHGLYR
jgi:nicotinic acid mononucleotide adenylyltransferase